MFGNDNVIDETDEEKEFTRYGMIWVNALKRMREDGVLERAVWIAPMNEVPISAATVQALVKLHEQPPAKGESQTERTRQEDAIYRRINGWMAAPIQAEIAREQIPISYSSLGAENYAARLTDHYDVVDVHFMPGVINDAQDQRRSKECLLTWVFPAATIPVFAGQKPVNNPLDTTSVLPALLPPAGITGRC